MLRHHLGAIDTVFTYSDLDLEGPSAEGRLTCSWLNVKVLEMRCEAIAIGLQPRERTFLFRGFELVTVESRGMRMLFQVEGFNDKNTEAEKCSVCFEKDESVPKCITLI